MPLYRSKNKKLPCTIQMNILRQSSLLLKPFPKARYYSDSTSAIELWLSVPRLLGVWLCHTHIFLIINTSFMMKKKQYGTMYTQKFQKHNRGIPDFQVRKPWFLGSKSLTLLEYNQHLVVWINGEEVWHTCKILRSFSDRYLRKIHIVVLKI